MRYMLLIYEDEAIWERITAAEAAAIWREVGEFVSELRQRGVHLTGAPLLPTCTATTVRMRDGKVLLTDGPFAETKEQLSGYGIVDVESLDEAVAIATRHPGVRAGRHAVEVRPIWQPPCPVV